MWRVTHLPSTPPTNSRTASASAAEDLVLRRVRRTETVVVADLHADRHLR
jgi:hypothetical protein